jgi:hypothetical protein
MLPLILSLLSLMIQVLSFNCLLLYTYIYIYYNIIYICVCVCHSNKQSLRREKCSSPSKRAGALTLLVCVTPTQGVFFVVAVSKYMPHKPYPIPLLSLFFCNHFMFAARVLLMTSSEKLGRSEARVRELTEENTSLKRTDDSRPVFYLLYGWPHLHSNKSERCLPARRLQSHHPRWRVASSCHHKSTYVLHAQLHNC